MADKRINELLDDIEAQYPPERLMNIGGKWERLWQGKTDGNPPVSIHRGVIYDGKRHPAYHSREECRETLVGKLEHISAMGQLDDDYLPVLDLETGAYILAESFGGKRINSKGLYMIHPPLKGPEGYKELHAFDPRGENFYMNKVFDYLRYVRKETGGRIPINIHTPQGPMETLGCLWNSTDFYMALLDHPRSVMEAMEKIVDAFIYYVRKQIEIIGEDHVQFNFALSYMHRPGGTGIGVGEDIIATVSSDIFDLSLPVYEKIARAFGPILLHSCGNPGHQLEKVLTNSFIKGIQFSQLEPEDFLPRIDRPLVVQSRNDWDDFKQLENYVRVARDSGVPIAYQFQSLGKYMQRGDDITCYDMASLKDMLVGIRKRVDVPF